MFHFSLSRFVSRLIIIALNAILACSAVPISTTTEQVICIGTMGNVDYAQAIPVTVDFGKAISINNLSLGVNIGHDFDFYFWRNDAALREKTQACNFRLIRLFVHEIQPCKYWNETSGEGNYSWTLFDKTLERVFEVGAEPLLVIASGSDLTKYWLPSRMEGNWQGSRFPSNASFGSFCADLVKHCNIDKQWNIRFWEIWNEPKFDDYNETTDQAFVNLMRIANFSKTFDNAADSIHAIDPQALCGHGYSAIQSFFDYFVVNSEGLGFISIHDYDAHSTEFFRNEYYKSDEEIIADALVIGYQKPGMWKTYSPQELRQKWFDAKKVELSILITETNMNSAYINGTDPRLQTIFGAVWYAEKLRASVLANISYSVYFTLTSGNFRDWNTTEITGGCGFGMLNDTAPYSVWFPYYTNWILGNFLAKGNIIYESNTPNSTFVSVMAWTTDQHHRILLIGKTTENIILNVRIENLDISNGTGALYIIDKTICEIQSTAQPYTNEFLISLPGYFLILIDIS